MKKAFLFLAVAASVLAFAACTEKEQVTPDGTDTTPVTPPTPQHNSLYQTTWAGTSVQTILNSITVTVVDTVCFLTDSTATNFIHFDAASILSKDSTMQCTYTWDDPNGVLTAVENDQLSTNFTKVNDTTINITVLKSNMTAMWPALSSVESYLPESFSINLIKQE